MRSIVPPCRVINVWGRLKHTVRVRGRLKIALCVQGQLFRIFLVVIADLWTELNSKGGTGAIYRQPIIPARVKLVHDHIQVASITYTLTVNQTVSIVIDRTPFIC